MFTPGAVMSGLIISGVIKVDPFEEKYAILGADFDLKRAFDGDIFATGHLVEIRYS